MASHTETREPAGRRLLTTRETAELLGFSTKSIFRLVDGGRLTPVRFHPRGPLRFPSDQVDGFMEPGCPGEEAA